MNYLSPFGEPCGHAQLKAYPQDFQVTEIPSFTPVGEGEHLWLWIRKTDKNTAWVAEQLANQSGLKLRDVSYAGRKDKVSVSEQWFSLYDPKRKSDDIVFEIDGCEILQSIRHSQKLRVGNLKGNKFLIRLREFDGDIDNVKDRIECIKATGFPNYFGLQRFGRRQSNLTKAIAWIESGGGRLRRDQRSLYLSTLRSFLFNQVLTCRIQKNNWNTVLPGELVQLAGNFSVFVADQSDPEFKTMQTRSDAFDIHSTGPLFGSGAMLPIKEAYELEQSVLEEYPQITAFLEKETVAMRRALRVVPENLNITQDKDGILINFALPAGSFATVLLVNIFQIKDVSQ